ncbi:glycosyltransferase family 4 protein [Alkalispirochaeta alkalica]|uniref:glycosyltransferase family 4 protein n=1 Tax=Alkalispirochaeta alkalica TaxID=46356 RepID=UPI0003A0B566|nr:glycosyltransferase family 1 protein [Alkalispirochaeta alkalica]
MKYIIGIDASNLLRGGGRTHIIEVLRAVDVGKHDVEKVIVWGAPETLDLLEYRDWLQKKSPKALGGGLLERSLWQRFQLSRQAEIAKCDLLFVPGGNFTGTFRPYVTMSRNMLPFEWREMLRFGFGLLTIKLFLLRLTQARSLRKADGAVFLTEYARKAVMAVIRSIRGEVTIISHGINTRFDHLPRPQRPISDYSGAKPYRIVYVSIVDQYKHQWNVVEAVGVLRRETGWPVTLDLVGPSYPPALKRLNEARRKWDPNNVWAIYHGAVPYDELDRLYKESDLGIFASTCENMPNILIEMMAAGLPIACSDRGPMPEILKDTGEYFDPLSSESIFCVLKKLIDSPVLRTKLSYESYEESKHYRWERCADETFSFLSMIARKTISSCDEIKGLDNV